MGSSDTSTDLSAARRLGLLLTGTEAKNVADRLSDGDTLTVALKPVSLARREQIRTLLATWQSPMCIAVLRAIEGARSAPTSVNPLWTMPGHVAQGGPLTSSISHVVDDARHSITCSTYNFQRSSALWGALGRAAQRPALALRIYLDTNAAEKNTGRRTPTLTEVAEHLHPATVLCTKDYKGATVRNHAKFIAIDHRFLVVTSANFSWSAEHGNIEFGVLIDDRNLAESIERELLAAEDILYERRVARSAYHPQR